MTYEETCQRLQKDYDGYHFTHNSIGIYNPFSLLNTFDKQEFGSYWFETGTPTYLVELLKRNHYNLEEMAHAETYADVLNSIYGDEDPLPVIFQSGYLTIKEYDPRFGLYRLGFPNREVEEGFVKFLMPFYTRFNKIECHPYGAGRQVCKKASERSKPATCCKHRKKICRQRYAVPRSYPGG